jgi:hypothetical protein
MQNLVIPFAIPQHNWNDLQTVYKHFGASSPTRTLEQSGVQVTQPSAFGIVFDHQGWAALHVSLSFLFLLPSTLSMEFEELLYTVNIHRLLHGNMGGDLLLGSATLLNWNLALLSLDKSPNECYNVIRKELAAYIRKYDI